MDRAPEGEETEQNLYSDLSLLPNQRSHRNTDRLINFFSQSEPTIMEEDPSDPLITSNDPVAPSTPNFIINENPDSASQFFNSTPSIFPSSPYEGFARGPDNSSPVLQNYLRDTVLGPDVTVCPLRDNIPELQVGQTMLIPVEDLVINGSQVDRVSSRDRLQQYPLVRFQRLLAVQSRSMATVLGTGSGLSHPDTSPERLRNNILALAASRKERLKNGKGQDTANAEKNGEDQCQCGTNFECNICFETSTEPVVTPCGHLFCWRCLYKWICMQLLGISECPVCKGEITESSLIPIYGRGGYSSASGPVAGVAMEEIPPRPTARRTDSTRQLMRREREVGVRNLGFHEVESMRMNLEAMVSRLRRLTWSNHGGSGVVGSTIDVISGGVAIRRGSGQDGEETGEGGGGEGTREGDRLDSGAGSSVAGEMHVHRRRRHRGEGDGLDSGAGSSVAGEMHLRRRRRHR